MTKKKVTYILLTSDNEPNIAVLATEQRDALSPFNEEKFSESIKGQLKTALMEHFDADVKVENISYRSSLPIDATVQVKVESSDEDSPYSMEIQLNETWVYGENASGKLV